MEVPPTLFSQVLIAMARFERPLSNTALNQSMMQSLGDGGHRPSCQTTGILEHPVQEVQCQVDPTSTPYCLNVWGLPFKHAHP